MTDDEAIEILKQVSQSSFTLSDGFRRFSESNVLSGGQDFERIGHWAESVGGRVEHEDRFPARISGQMVDREPTVFRAIAVPEYLFADHG